MKRYWMLAVILASLVWGMATILKAQEPTPPTQKPTNGAAKLPAIPELKRYKIENALYRIAFAEQNYKRIVTAEWDGIRGDIAEFEKSHDGYTIDTSTLPLKVAEKKAK